MRWGVLVVGSLVLINARPDASHGGADNPLLGTWRVISAVTRTEGMAGEQVKPASGYLIFTPEHRIVTLSVTPPRRPATTEADELALARSMMVYTGKFQQYPDRYTFRMEFSSTQLNLDQEQTRYYRIDGDQMTVTTPVHDSLVAPGLRGSTTLILKRER